MPFQKAMLDQHNSALRYKADSTSSMMSGASGTNFNIMSDLVARNTATVARSVGCTQDDPDSQATLNCLRYVPLERLMNVSVSLARRTRPPFGEVSFYPSYDGDYIPDRPSVLLRKGALVKGMLWILPRRAYSEHT